jgi:hypothetical protein
MAGAGRAAGPGASAEGEPGLSGLAALISVLSSLLGERTSKTHDKRRTLREAMRMELGVQD